MSQVVYRSEARIERVRDQFEKHTCRQKQRLWYSVSTGLSLSTTRFRRPYWNLTPRRWIISSRLPLVDLPAPSEARWKRVI
jgi:hypothetical protein